MKTSIPCIGLVTLQIVWLILIRLGSLFWEAPIGPAIAFTTVALTGPVVSIIAGRRLAASIGPRQSVSRE